MQVAADEDLYAVLGLVRGADERQIKEAYRRLAKSFHPDVNRGDAHAAERFKQIAAAYRILSDPQLRAEYASRRFGNSPSTFAEHLRRTQTESTVGKPSPEAVPRPASNITIKLHLTLEELAQGVTRKLRFTRRIRCPICAGIGVQMADEGICEACRGSGKVPDLTAIKGRSQSWIPCRRCGGTGRRVKNPCANCRGRGQVEEDSAVNVTVPPGADQGSSIIIKEQGHEDRPGKKNGDVCVVIVTKEHPHLRRNGADLIHRCRLTLTQWLEGATLQVPALEETIALRLAPGLKSEGCLKVRGRGMPRADGSRGDLLVEYRLCVPRKLNKKQQALLKRLEATPGFQPETSAG
jgi:molecular chaperone DnaJ